MKKVSENASPTIDNQSNQSCEVRLFFSRIKIGAPRSHLFSAFCITSQQNFEWSFGFLRNCRKLLAAFLEYANHEGKYFEWIDFWVTDLPNLAWYFLFVYHFIGYLAWADKWTHCLLTKESFFLGVMLQNIFLFSSTCFYLLVLYWVTKSTMFF